MRNDPARILFSAAAVIALISAGLAVESKAGPKSEAKEDAVRPEPTEPGRQDQRNIRAGMEIPNEGYCDQPYIVRTRDGAWLCALTTGKGLEGQTGQHVVATISPDKGKTWSDLIDIEPASGPEASWVVPLVTPSGRIYAFYSYNGDNVRTLNGKKIRADMMGWHCFKYSDDNGRTWSPERYRLPMRVTNCDRGNDWRGEVQIFWGIDKPKVFGDAVFLSFTKLGRYILDQGEGWLFMSDNILSESDPAAIRWEMLPVGEKGLRADVFGSVQEEHNTVPLNDGKSLYCVYRTTTGHPCHSYSRDRGRTWTTPEHMTYAPGGRRIKNPRACPKLWKTSDGRYLFWFHNHSGKDFKDRNPAWITGGIEKDGMIRWSQPEILLYDPEPATRMSYPDLVEEDGRFWVTETNKDTARVHEIEPELLRGLWSQDGSVPATRDGLLIDVGADEISKSASFPLKLDAGKGGGVSIDLWITTESAEGVRTILDSRDNAGRGMLLETSEGGAVRLVLNDGANSAEWTSDAGLLAPGKTHNVVAIVDNGPRIIAFVVDGVLCDGGEARQFGWGRYGGRIGDVSGSGNLKIGSPGLKDGITRVRVFTRAVRISEAVAGFNRGL
ncbi:MAG TPA: exo-alpha-sialidase [Candidatus Brocadiia bacterium]|nr:exo-alpha-sialidase [Candidatus Brocadiia bacterium]